MCDSTFSGRLQPYKARTPGVGGGGQVLLPAPAAFCSLPACLPVKRMRAAQAYSCSVTAAAAAAMVLPLALSLVIKVALFGLSWCKTSYSSRSRSDTYLPAAVGTMGGSLRETWTPSACVSRRLWPRPHVPRQQPGQMHNCHALPHPQTPPPPQSIPCSRQASCLGNKQPLWCWHSAGALHLGSTHSIGLDE